MAGRITKPTLRRLMAIEISLTEGCLRRFTLVRRELDPQTALARCLDAVRTYTAEGDYLPVCEAISSLFEELAASSPSS
jgi:hypothetical protein